MSFRVEEKYNVSKNKIFYLKNWLFNNKIYKIFPDRKISSLYLDNEMHQMYHESIEGIVPRHKLRVRFYNDDFNNSYFERKISSVEGRFKKVKKIDLNKVLKYGYFDKFYGNCNFILMITYDRSYFKYQNYRFTLDTNIKFYKKLLNSKFSKIPLKSDKCVLELKCKEIDKKKIFYQKINLEKIRFSKYCEGLQIIFKKND